MYDAGDLVKFGLPMAFTATMLSWAILEYGDQMKAVKQLDYARDSLKWIADYLVNAHPSPNVLYIQVDRKYQCHFELSLALTSTFSQYNSIFGYKVLVIK